MLIHQESLYHCRCDHDPNHHWNVCDIPLKAGDVMACPHCHRLSVIEGVQSHALPPQACYTIDVEQEVDGRWLAEIPQLSGAMAYGADAKEAMDNTLRLAEQIMGHQADQSELQEALAAREEARREGTIPFEQLKSELDLSDE